MPRSNLARSYQLQSSSGRQCGIKEARAICLLSFLLFGKGRSKLILCSAQLPLPCAAHCSVQLHQLPYPLALPVQCDGTLCSAWAPVLVPRKRAQHTPLGIAPSLRDNSLALSVLYCLKMVLFLSVLIAAYGRRAIPFQSLIQDQKQKSDSPAYKS